MYAFDGRSYFAFYPIDLKPRTRPLQIIMGKYGVCVIMSVDVVHLLIRIAACPLVPGRSPQASGVDLHARLIKNTGQRDLEGARWGCERAAIEWLCTHFFVCARKLENKGEIKYIPCSYIVKMGRVQSIGLINWIVAMWPRGLVRHDVALMGRSFLGTLEVWSFSRWG